MGPAHGRVQHDLLMILADLGADEALGASQSAYVRPPTFILNGEARAQTHSHAAMTHVRPC
jgi:hypothetical protein